MNKYTTIPPFEEELVTKKAEFINHLKDQPQTFKILITKNEELPTDYGSFDRHYHLIQHLINYGNNFIHFEMQSLNWFKLYEFKEEIEKWGKYEILIERVKKNNETETELEFEMDIKKLENKGKCLINAANDAMSYYRNYPYDDKKPYWITDPYGDSEINTIPELIKKTPVRFRWIFEQKTFEITRYSRNCGHNHVKFNKNGKDYLFVPISEVVNIGHQLDHMAQYFKTELITKKGHVIDYDEYNPVFEADDFINLYKSCSRVQKGQVWFFMKLINKRRTDSKLRLFLKEEKNSITKTNLVPGRDIWNWFKKYFETHSIHGIYTTVKEEIKVEEEKVIAILQRPYSRKDDDPFYHPVVAKFAPIRKKWLDEKIESFTDIIQQRRNPKTDEMEDFVFKTKEERIKEFKHKHSPRIAMACKKRGLFDEAKEFFEKQKPNVTTITKTTKIKPKQSMADKAARKRLERIDRILADDEFLLKTDDKESDEDYLKRMSDKYEELKAVKFTKSKKKPRAKKKSNRSKSNREKRFEKGAVLNSKECESVMKKLKYSQCLNSYLPKVEEDDEHDFFQASEMRYYKLSRMSELNEKKFSMHISRKFFPRFGRRIKIRKMLRKTYLRPELPSRLIKSEQTTTELKMKMMPDGLIDDVKEIVKNKVWSPRAEWVILRYQAYKSFKIEFAKK